MLRRVIRFVKMSIFRCDSISTNTLYTYTGYSLCYSQSANHLLGHDSRPFRQVQVIKKAITAITAITAIMANGAIRAILANTAIRIVIAITGITDSMNITAVIQSLQVGLFSGLRSVSGLF